jgi:succinate dehydrogenase/fumarate reductase flavoprotein subunit
MAGQTAAEYAREKETSIASEALKRRWERKAKGYLKKKRGSFDHPRDLLKSLKELAWKYAGPIREAGSLEEGLARLASLEKRVEAVYPATLRDLFSKRDLENMCLLTRAIFKGSLLRKESRGSFFRKDFPNQDDQNGLENTCYRLEKGELRITHQPIKA